MFIKAHCKDFYHLHPRMSSKDAVNAEITAHTGESISEWPWPFIPQVVVTYQHGSVKGVSILCVRESLQWSKSEWVYNYKDKDKILHNMYTKPEIDVFQQSQINSRVLRPPRLPFFHGCMLALSNIRFHTCGFTVHLTAPSSHIK